MKPLFEIPELLTLSGEKFNGTLMVTWAGPGCSDGCESGCNDGCDKGGGTGKKPTIMPFDPQ